MMNIFFDESKDVKQEIYDIKDLLDSFKFKNQREFNK